MNNLNNKNLIVVALNITLIIVIYFLGLNFFLGAIFLFPFYLLIYLYGVIYYIRNLKAQNSFLIILGTLLGFISLNIHGYLQALMIDYADFGKDIPIYINFLSATFGVFIWSLPLSCIYSFKSK